MPPLSKVRCCRPKEFGRLPEGLLRRTSPSPQSLQKNDNPSPLANPSKTALSLSLFVGERACPSRCIEPLHPHNLLKAHPSPRPAPSRLPPLSKGGGLTASHKLSLCCVLLATRPPFYSLNFSAVKTEGLLYHPSLSTTSMPPLTKVRCCRPKEFGRLPEGLPHHHPSPLANPSKTALSHENRQHTCLLMNALFISHPCLVSH